MPDDAYCRLPEFPHGLPGGLADSEAEIKIPKRHFTPEEGQIFMQLKTLPESISTIAERGFLQGADRQPLTPRKASSSKRESFIPKRGIMSLDFCTDFLDKAGIKGWPIVLR